MPKINTMNLIVMSLQFDATEHFINTACPESLFDAENKKAFPSVSIMSPEGEIRAKATLQLAMPEDRFSGFRERYLDDSDTSAIILLVNPEYTKSDAESFFHFMHRQLKDISQIVSVIFINNKAAADLGLREKPRDFGWSSYPLYVSVDSPEDVKKAVSSVIRCVLRKDYDLPASPIAGSTARITSACAGSGADSASAEAPSLS